MSSTAAPIAMEGDEDEAFTKAMEQMIALSTTQHNHAPTSPMRLCDLCSRLNTKILSDLFPKPRNYRYVRHQPSFTALVISATAGCEMCFMFLDATVDEYCRDEGCDKRRGYQILRSISARRGQPCLIQPAGANNKISYLMYQLPKVLQEDIDDENKFLVDETRLSFVLSNCCGSYDESIRRCELSPKPNFDIAGRWIRQCKENHKDCQGVSFGGKTGRSHDPLPLISELPTRVIEVGVEGTQEPRLYLSGGFRAEYVALSHCWGGSKPLVTRLSNLHQHQISIPFSNLPKTFKDAVAATRKLGYRFLWIDSLCIIQDSPEDWEQECTKMASIYQNAVVTIAGTRASDSYAGFLHERPPPQPVARIWEYTNPCGDKPNRVTLWLNNTGLYSSQKYPDSTELMQAESYSVLQDRGWILQENLLSPRLLYVGPFRLYWQCFICVHFEDFPTEDSPQDKPMHSSIHKSEFLSMLSGKSLYQWSLSDAWYSIITEYTGRSLTMPTDKLPAISAVARWLLGECGEDYIAGLPKKNFLIGLAWLIMLKVPKPQVSIYRAPSWSWASTDSRVVFVGAGIRKQKSQNASKNDEIHNTDPEEELLEEQRSRICGSISQQTRMMIYDTRVELEGKDPFGQIKWASISLKGKIKIGRITFNANPKRNQLPVRDPNDDFKAQEERLQCYFYPDDRQKLFKDRLPVSILDSEDSGNNQSSLSSSFDIECVCLDMYSHGWHALGIEPISQDMLPPNYRAHASGSKYKPYRRIGMLRTTGYPSPKQADMYSWHWFKDAEWEHIELF